jgi:[FeFe] hydrogenase H-cluster maturation GTPase HydF
VNAAPRNTRVHIGIFGRRNTGKSSLLNALTGQNAAIVSDFRGTTTDPVEKPMELQPLGPVLFIDTAGIDDEGAVGRLRIEKTRSVLRRVDVGIIVAEADEWGDYESGLARELESRSIPIIAVFNKTDVKPLSPATAGRIGDPAIRIAEVSALYGSGIDRLRAMIAQCAPAAFGDAERIAADLVPAGEVCVLVVPIDKEAPRGRLILPQVQTIRDLLDHDAMALVVKERELGAALAALVRPPRLVVTDSQAFLKVAADTPPGLPLTSFSILFARFLGDLDAMVEGAAAIDTLKTGDRVLIAESCTHHPITDDIGTVKIPRWITQYTGSSLSFEHARGHDFPDDLAGFKLVIHCGGCMNNRREMLARIRICRAAGVPVTNYGLTIAYSLGIFERALGPFPGALAAYRRIKSLPDACS